MSMVEHVIGRLKVEVLLRLADFMTKRRLPAQRWGSTGCACKVTARRTPGASVRLNSPGHCSGPKSRSMCSGLTA